MKKLIFSLVIVVILCYSKLIFSASTQTTKDWTGFYLGGNAGYWGSQNNTINSTASVNFINQTYEFGASDIANALAQLATNKSSLNSYGFIGGAQAGYNYTFSNRFL